jgi:osmotically-inducible protein OsmY
MNKQMHAVAVVATFILAFSVPLWAQYAQTLGPITPFTLSERRISSLGDATDDREVVLRVRQALARDKSIAVLGLRVTAIDGKVKLSGVAPTQLQADRAIALARNVVGVKSVKSDIGIH